MRVAELNASKRGERSSSRGAVEGREKGNAEGER
jgi:hypothetical protein